MHFFIEIISYFSSAEHKKFKTSASKSVDVYSNLTDSYQCQKWFFSSDGYRSPHKAMKKRRIKLLFCNIASRNKAKSLMDLSVNALLEYIMTCSLY